MTASPSGDGDLPARGGVKGPETSQTLSRGLRVLETLAETSEEQTASELSRAVGLPRPVLYRLLATMVAHRLVRRGPQGGYVVALGVLELGRNVLPALGMDAHAVLRQLAEESGAAAHLAVAEGEESVAVAVVEPRSATYHLAYRVGSRLPVSQGALGRAILAGRDGRSELCTSTGEVIPGTSGAALAGPGPRDRGRRRCRGAAGAGPVRRRPGTAVRGRSPGCLHVRRLARLSPFVYLDAGDDGSFA